MNCPKCGVDISESYQPDDPSVGINGGWFCEACDLPISDNGYREGMEDDVHVEPAQQPLGTPISQLSGRPGHPGYEEFKRIAASWGYD